MTNQAPQLSEMTATTAGRSYTLRYFDRPGSGPTILYVHGLGCSKADFTEMTSVPELQSFRLVCADNPGCGNSSYDECQPLNIDGVVEVIENFVGHLGLNRFLLVGGSMGGLVAVLYAERNLNKVAGFVNVEGNLAPEDCMFSRNVISPNSYSMKLTTSMAFSPLTASPTSRRSAHAKNSKSGIARRARTHFQHWESYPSGLPSFNDYTIGELSMYTFLEMMEEVYEAFFSQHSYAQEGVVPNDGMAGHEPL